MKPQQVRRGVGSESESWSCFEIDLASQSSSEKIYDAIFLVTTSGDFQGGVICVRGVLNSRMQNGRRNDAA